MMSMMGLLESVSTPLPLCPKLASIVGKDTPMTILEIIMVIETHLKQTTDPNTIILTEKIQQLFETTNTELSIDQFNNHFFKIIPLILLNYNGYYLITNTKYYTRNDLQVDRKMFKIAVEVGSSPSNMGDHTPSALFKKLPTDVLHHIAMFLPDGRIPFHTPYHFRVYESLENHDKQLLAFWKRI